MQDIKDDEIRIISSETNRRKIWLWLVAAAIVIAIVAFFALRPKEPESQETVFEPVTQVETETEIEYFGTQSDISFTEIKDTVLNDIPLRLFIPHNAKMSLQIGRPDKSDSSIIYIAQAADVRADNGGIVGAFVLAGEPKAWGLSKKGYCAAIGDSVFIGVADNSPLFEQATEEGGYFFRQYPLVDKGYLVENQPKGKAVRRGICDRAGEIFMVESLSEESFHDFAQALVDLGVDNAVYLVGSVAWGWATDAEGLIHEFGDENIYKNWRRRMPANTSYLVWQKNDKKYEDYSQQ